MKSKTINLLVGALVGATLPLQAGPRTSASYSMPTDTADLGGKKTASSSYSIDTSIGGVAGIATVVAPAETAKTGYIAQLYEVTGLALNATPPTIDEGGTRQLSAWQTLDDATFLAVPANSVTWSIVSGPLTSISAGGLATAGIVCEEDLPAVARGAFGGFIGSLTLTVKNVNKDNFGLYASDGIDDAWQKFYFGIDNPQGFAGADPDGDGRINLGEWAFGLNPTVGDGGEIMWSGNAVTQRGLPVPNVTNITNGVDFKAVFGQRKNYVEFGLTYTVQFSADLMNWESSAATPAVIASEIPPTPPPLEIDAVAVPYPLFLSTGRKAQFFRVQVSHP